MGRVSPPVAVTNELIGPNLVFIRTRPTLHDRRGGDAEGNLRQDGWLEDALRSKEGHSPPFEIEPSLKDLVRKRVRM